MYFYSLKMSSHYLIETLIQYSPKITLIVGDKLSGDAFVVFMISLKNYNKKIMLKS